MTPQEKKELIDNELCSLNIALNGWISHEMGERRTKNIIDIENEIESKKIELRTLKIQFGV
jgi:hypothetical protein